MNSSLFLYSVCIIKSDVINFQHVLTSFAVFQSFTDLFRELNDGEIENHYKMNSKNVETIQKTREGHAKTRCTLCTKWTISFEVSGFSAKTHMLQRHCIFLNLFELQNFVCWKCTIKSHIIIFQPFLTSFVIFHAFTDYFEL